MSDVCPSRTKSAIILIATSERTTKKMPLSVSKQVKPCVSELVRVNWTWTLDSWTDLMNSIGFTETRTGEDNCRIYYNTTGNLLFSASVKNKYITIFDSLLERSIDDQNDNYDAFIKDYVDEIDYSIFEDRFEKYKNIWHLYLDDISDAIGKPYFAGVMGDADAMDDEEYPKNEAAMAVAYWNLKNAKLKLTLNNDLLEDPCAILLTVMPLDSDS